MKNKTATKKLTKRPNKKTVKAKSVVSKKNLIKRRKRVSFVSLALAVLFAGLSFVAYKKKYARLCAFFAAIASLNTAFAFVEFGAFLSPILSYIPTLSVACTVFGMFVFSIVNIVSPKTAKGIFKNLTPSK